jgi:hypothetical protein
MKKFGHGFSHGSVTVLVTIKGPSFSSFIAMKNGLNGSPGKGFVIIPRSWSQPVVMVLACPFKARVLRSSRRRLTRI